MSETWTAGHGATSRRHLTHNARGCLTSTMDFGTAGSDDLSYVAKAVFVPGVPGVTWHTPDLTNAAAAGGAGGAAAAAEAVDTSHESHIVDALGPSQKSRFFQSILCVVFA